MKNRIWILVLFVSIVALFVNGQAGCGDNDTGLLGPLSIQHNGTRDYYVYVPESYERSGAPVPLIVDLHGFTSTATSQFEVSGFDRIADAEGLLVVYPKGIVRSWNAGFTCCPPANLIADDVGFIRKVVEAVTADYPNIDSSRIYATGLSNGGAMANRLAMDAEDVFAAIVSYSQYLIIPADPLSRPVPTMEVHGYGDDIVPYYGSLASSAPNNFDTWGTHNMCTSEKTVEELTGPCDGDSECNKCETLTNCADQTEVSLCSIKSEHNVYNNSQGIDVTQIGWDFLKRFSLP